MQKKSLILYVGILLAISGLMFTNGAVLQNQGNTKSDDVGNSENAATIGTCLTGTTGDSVVTLSAPVEAASEPVSTTSVTTGAPNSTSPPQTFEEWRDFFLAYINMTLDEYINLPPEDCDEVNRYINALWGYNNGTLTEDEAKAMIGHNSPQILFWGPGLIIHDWWWHTTFPQPEAIYSSDDKMFIVAFRAVAGYYGLDTEEIYRVVAYLDSNQDPNVLPPSSPTAQQLQMVESLDPYDKGYVSGKDWVARTWYDGLGAPHYGISSAWRFSTDYSDFQAYVKPGYVDYDGVKFVIGYYWRVFNIFSWSWEDKGVTWESYYYTTVSDMAPEWPIIIFDDDINPPVVEDVVIGIADLVADNWPTFRVGVKATDANGIDQTIYVNGVPHETTYSVNDGYYWTKWTAIENPRVPGFYSLEIVVWDKDLDWAGDDLPSAATVWWYTVFDDDLFGPTIHEVVAFPVDDTQGLIPIRINATDPKGIYPKIMFNWIFYNATYRDGFYWILVPSPGIPRVYLGTIMIWDTDNDWPLDPAVSVAIFPYLVYDDDVKPPDVSWSATDIHKSGDNIEFTLTVTAEDQRGIGLVWITMESYVFNDLGAHSVTLPPGKYTAHISVTDNDNDWPGDDMTTYLEVPIILDIEPPSTQLIYSGPTYTHEGICYVENGAYFALTVTDDVCDTPLTYYIVNDGPLIEYKGGWVVLTGPDGCTHTIQYYSIDNNGNAEPLKTQTIVIDDATPDTALTLSGTHGTGDWFISDVEATLTPTDGTSGIAWTLYSYNGSTWFDYKAPFLIEPEGTITLYYFSIDNLGHREEVKTATMNIDKVAPETTISLTGMQGLADWYLSDVVITLEATDHVPGSNAVTTEYRIGQNNWEPYKGPITITTEGTTTIYYKAVDLAGNTEPEKSTTISIDKVKPVTSASLSGTQGPDEWFISDVDVSLTATDGLSGVKYTEYSLDNGKTWTHYESPFTITYRTITTLYYRSMDNAGNLEGIQSKQVKICILAQTTIGPSTLNLKSKGQWVTVYIQLPEGYNTNEIDISSLELRFGDQVIQASWGEIQDGILMVKFDRATLIDMLSGIQPDTLVQLEIWGHIGDWIFAGTVTVKVI